MKGDEQKELKVVDNNTGYEVTAYFKPEKARLGSSSTSSRRSEPLPLTASVNVSRRQTAR
jgi:hypothetical protein